MCSSDLPGLIALLALLLIERRRAPALPWLSCVSIWALVCLPPVLLVLLAGSRMPWGGLAGLAGALALATIITRWALGQSGKRRWSMLILLCLAIIAGRWLMLLGAVPAPSSPLPLVGVVSALPLYGPVLAEADQRSVLDGAGRMSPLWQVLRSSHDLRPLDRLDAASLAPFRQLLIAQPRQLAPEELVALDGWVRRGGSALILADPLLHWPDSRPLGDARRAPLTSLLDPLLAHWGLRLEAAQQLVEERRVFDDGALLQMAGASRFTLTGGACRLAENGLIARCSLGQGQARLIADADWINDTLWTLDPAHPGDRAAWTSDAVPALTSWLQSDALRVASPGVWLVSQDRLIIALRYALTLLLALAILDGLVARVPINSQRVGKTKPDQRRNKPETILDTR